MAQRKKFWVFLGAFCFFMIAGGVLAFAMDTLQDGQMLRIGDTLKSQNGQYRLVLQSDGNLVLYNRHRAIWSTGTLGKHAKKLMMQSDGNLVLYGTGGPIWASNTSGNRDAFVKLQDDGNLVIYKAIWSTGTAK